MTLFRSLQILYSLLLLLGVGGGANASVLAGMLLSLSVLLFQMVMLKVHHISDQDGSLSAVRVLSA